jgi:hypothetical protein
MSWTKALIAGVAAGIAVGFANFILHAVILGSTYAKYDVFTQEPTNPAYFFLVAVCIAICAAFLFARSRDSWAPGAKGGATFGFWLGLVAFFSPFYSPLVLKGFPYFLAWCQGGADLIAAIVGGTVLGLVYKGS